MACNIAKTGIYVYKKQACRKGNKVRLAYLLKRPIAFHAVFVDITGSINAALMLSQAIYWQERAQREDGFWYKTQSEWAEETRMSRKEQEGARKKLRTTRLFEEKKMGVPAKIYYRVNLDRLEDTLIKLMETTDCPKGANKDVPNGQAGMPQTDKLDRPKGANLSAQKGQTFKGTETTTEITTETTTTNRVVVVTDWNGIRPQEQSGMLTVLEKLANPAQAQALLDELADNIAAGTIKKSRLTLLRKLVELANAGKFNPTSERAYQRARRRAQKEQLEKTARQSEQAAGRNAGERLKALKKAINPKEGK